MPYTFLFETTCEGGKPAKRALNDNHEEIHRIKNFLEMKG
jgi:hypothetical protein